MILFSEINYIVGEGASNRRMFLWGGGVKLVKFCIQRFNYADLA